MMCVQLWQLQGMGHSSKTMRYYLWFKHFVILKDFEAAAYFLELLRKCRHEFAELVPLTWRELRQALDVAIGGKQWLSG